MRYSILRIQKNGALGVVFFVKDKEENNEMYLLLIMKI
jgi:hypothetical protein